MPGEGQGARALVCSRSAVALTSLMITGVIPNLPFVQGCRSILDSMDRNRRMLMFVVMYKCQ